MKLGADLKAGEARHSQTGILENRRDRELVVTRVVLLEKCNLLEERTEATFDNFMQRQKL